jgi:PilZ domain
MPNQNPGYRDKRRAHVRYSHTLRTKCRALGREGAASWAARVHDVSRTGVALRMGREVREGEVLVVALEGFGGRFARPVLMRVIRVRAEAGAGWVVGCTFVIPLTENDVEALLLGGRPAGRESHRLPL